MKQRLAWQFDTQLAGQEIPYLQGTLRFINVFTRAQNRPHLNQMNSIHIPMPHIFILCSLYNCILEVVLSLDILWLKFSMYISNKQKTQQC